MFLALLVPFLPFSTGAGDLQNSNYMHRTNTRSLQTILENHTDTSRWRCLSHCTAWFNPDYCQTPANFTYCRCGAVNISPQGSKVRCELVDYDDYNAGTIVDSSVTLYTLKPMCDTNWYYFDGICYYFTSELRNRTENIDACASMGAYLAEIYTEIVFNFIVRMFESGKVDMTQHFYLNGYRPANTSDFIWPRKGTKINETFHNWGPGKPEDCCTPSSKSSLRIMTTYPYHWNGLYSKTDKFAICEKPKV